MNLKNSLQTFCSKFFEDSKNENHRPMTAKCAFWQKTHSFKQFLMQNL